jgi:acylphosphatase
MKRLRAIVRGRVQGVGYRAFVQAEARRLDLTGTVRNCPTGEVEVVAEGPEERLRGLERQLAGGPLGARVDAVEMEWSTATGEYAGFRVRY